ncbi:MULTISPECIES: SRPBCC family protein [unclassified Nocardioides]|uniref:SRPBCC family protein n=1 Tax=unclassified Nocardioides TaxID=2615069 RepID=UPI0006FB4285|nr:MULTISPECIES: SRPBCC family protein [unclassified Nocardioides]KRA29676.1 transcriptional regulator [Nocardioides sp. Root614]KRA88148.1 transcriptional regulator [Nocardioides sp. Root682]
MPAFSQTHETTIAAPPATVHALIADFHEWIKWSPWEGLDPELGRTYEGEGVGARYTWSGNKKAGEGAMTFAAITPEEVKVDLQFLKPFKAENDITFTLTPAGEGTRVAWTMSGNRNLVFAVLGKLFFDKAIGKDFEKGLASLKAAADKA